MTARTDVRDLKWLAERVVVDPDTGCHLWTRNRAAFGYGQYSVTRNGVHRTHTAHRLALTLRLGRPIRPGMQAIHLCDNPPCCRPDHLIEGTPKDNMADRDRKNRGVLPNHRGVDIATARLTPADVLVIREAMANGESQRSVARRYGVHHSTIRDIATGATWSHV